MSGLERVSTADRVIGGAYGLVAAGVVVAAGVEGGEVAALALAAVLLGFPALGVAIWSLAHYQATSGDAPGGAE